jgi:hypothetical protein
MNLHNFRPLQNGIFAIKDIKKGDFLYSEVPFVWSREVSNGGSSDEAQSKITDVTCSQCGCFYENKVSCLECNVIYCSEKCKLIAYQTHHSILCCSTGNQTGGPNFNEAIGHYGCILKIIAKIIIDLNTTSQLLSVNAATEIEIEAYMKNVIGQFFCPPYTRAIHSFRGGKEMPENLFQNMFQSSYFESHLRKSYEKLKKKFPIKKYGQTFFDVCLSERFYDSLRGMSLCNNMSVSIIKDDMIMTGSAMYEIYSKGNHSCISDISNLALMSTPLIPIPGDESSRSGSNGSSGSSGNSGSSTKLDSELLYERVGVNVFAAHDITKGSEIHTCYLHGGSGEHISKKERTSQLTQYLFKCDCQLCKDELDPESEGSDY